MKLNEVYLNPDEFIKNFVDFGPETEDRVEAVDQETKDGDQDNPISVSYLTRGYGAGQTPEGEAIITTG